MANKEFYVLVHNIRSMHNVGAIFRTSDGAGVKKIFLTGYTACPPRKEISKTALGSDEMVSWEYHKDPVKLVESLKSKDVKVIALEKNEESQNLLKAPSLSEPTCMIIGNEIEGVSPELLELSEEVYHLPMRGEKVSLNVSVAFGIALYNLIEC